MMSKNRLLIFFSVFVLLFGCSFDNKTGIWKGFEEDKRKALDLENEQNRELVTIYSSAPSKLQEINALKNINLSTPKNNTSWQMPDLNLQNFTGNIYFSGLDNNFLKKKIGKNKFHISKIMSSPIIFEDNIILSNDTGTIFHVTQKGKIKWKRNIYKKLYKKIYKKLSFSIYKNVIYVSDNIGYVYALNFDTGDVIWLKNLYVPLKSKLKIFENKIFLINQDNRVLCLDINDGSKIWDIRSITSFIKTQNFLPLAISKDGHIVTLGSSGELMKIKSNNGQMIWAFNVAASSFAHDTDFFNSSNIVLLDNEIIFFASDSIFSFNFENGFLNWKKDIKSSSIPILENNYIFLISDDGYFLCLKRNDGKIIWSTNILKILKEKKRNTRISGFVMGSNKIYATTGNGYLITSSASSGKVESFKKIGDPITSSPIISDGSLYVFTENSRIFGFN